MLLLSVLLVSIPGRSALNLFYRILIQMITHLSIRCLPLFEPPLSGGVLGAPIGGPQPPQFWRCSPEATLGNRLPPFC